MEHDVIIVDNELAEEAERSLREAMNAEEVLEGLVALLEDVLKNGAKDGAMAQNLRAYTNCIAKMRGQMEEIVVQQSSIINSFVMDIDAADSYIYG